MEESTQKMRLGPAAFWVNKTYWEKSIHLSNRNSFKVWSLLMISGKKIIHDDLHLQKQFCKMDGGSADGGSESVQVWVGEDNQGTAKFWIMIFLKSQKNTPLPVPPPPSPASACPISPFIYLAIRASSPSNFYQRNLHFCPMLRQWAKLLLLLISIWGVREVFTITILLHTERELTASIQRI